MSLLMGLYKPKCILPFLSFEKFSGISSLSGASLCRCPGLIFSFTDPSSDCAIELFSFPFCYLFLLLFLFLVLGQVFLEELLLLGRFPFCIF